MESLQYIIIYVVVILFGIGVVIFIYGTVMSMVYGTCIVDSKNAVSTMRGLMTDLDPGESISSDFRIQNCADRFVFANEESIPALSKDIGRDIDCGKTDRKAFVIFVPYVSSALLDKIRPDKIPENLFNSLTGKYKAYCLPISCKDCRFSRMVELKKGAEASVYCVSFERQGDTYSVRYRKGVCNEAK